MFEGLKGIIGQKIVQSPDYVVVHILSVPYRY